MPFFSIQAQDRNEIKKSIEEYLIGEWSCISEVSYHDDTYFNILDIYNPENNILPYVDFEFLDGGFGYTVIMTTKSRVFMKDQMVWSVEEKKATPQNIIVLNTKTSSSSSNIREGVIMILSNNVFVLSCIEDGKTRIYNRKDINE